GLADGAQRARRGEQILEPHRAAGAEARPILEPHPRLGDDAENAFGADEHSIGARPGARAGQTPRLDAALRGDHREAFDEIVDMGIEAGVMATAARCYPAAERRIFEALREMAQGQAMRLQLRLERGAVR